MKTELSHYSDKHAGPDTKLEVKTSAKRKSLWEKWPVYLIGLIVLLVVFFISYLNFLNRPLNASEEFKYFEVKKGVSTMEIGSELVEQGIIRSKLAFFIYAKSEFKPLQAGQYKISSNMPMEEVLNKMQEGDVDAFSITVPEGFRVLQIAKLLQEKEQMDPAKFIAAAVSTEGTLFPDTYVFPKNLEASKIVKMMKDDYEQRTKDLKLNEDQLILASIVEREARTDDERPKIAAVFLNRVAQNMKLQSDPTVSYALDTSQYLTTKLVNFEFWKAPTSAELKSVNSPFNTYIAKGLPPAPICNPGLKSINAVLNPAKDFGDYYYFFHDKSQQVHFSKTYSEQQAAIAQFGV